LTKKAYESTLQNNPYIDKLIFLENVTENLRTILKQESYDAIIDLHNNIRSRRFSIGIASNIKRFDKVNFSKWLFVNLKINRLPDHHIVDRYLATTQSFGVKNDGEGLDYFHGLDANNVCKKYGLGADSFVSVAIGGQHCTKKLPLGKLQELVSRSGQKVVLLGGREDTEMGDAVSENFNHVINLCGKISLNESAAVIEKSRWVIAHDTGLMHIAAAFKKDIISIWGNTVPEFGMFPYCAGNKSRMIEVRNLSCRPCSKIGFDQCPKGHFNCMNQINTGIITNLINC
jgi:heptosyltransferase-2